MMPKENEEVRKQVQEFLDKGLIRESLSFCVTPTVLSPNKGGEWRMCTNSRAIKKNRQRNSNRKKTKKNQLLKKNINDKSMLKLPDFNQPFQVSCDASRIAIGVVLSQEDKPDAYFSEKLNESKHKYSSYDKELYVMVQALNHWRHYLMPNEFVVYMDNFSLQCIM